MNANRHELLLHKEVYAVVGCAIEVLNVRGHGLHERIYENCLCVRFSPNSRSADVDGVRRHFPAFRAAALDSLRFAHAGRKFSRRFSGSANNVHGTEPIALMLHGNEVLCRNSFREIAAIRESRIA